MRHHMIEYDLATSINNKNKYLCTYFQMFSKQ